MIAPTRPLLRWHGGKWKLAPWVISHFPPHRIYVEPFGGAASVLLRKQRSYGEIYNDLDDDVVNLFRLLREPSIADRLVQQLRLTPFARLEFRGAYEDTQDHVERARRLIIRSFMGFGSNAHASQANGHRSTGFRATGNRSGTTPAHDWANYPACLQALIERLTGVVIEHREATACMAQHDRPDTLHYVDPPYVHATRAPSGKVDLKNRMYAHELSDGEHHELLAFLRGLEGMVVLSGYAHPLYDDALHDWVRTECRTFADGARERTEVLWINPQAADARARRDLPLLAGGAASDLMP